MLLLSEVLKVLRHDAKVLAEVVKVCHGSLEGVFDGVDFLHGDNGVLAHVGN